MSHVAKEINSLILDQQKWQIHQYTLSQYWHWIRSVQKLPNQGFFYEKTENHTYIHWKHYNLLSIHYLNSSWNLNWSSDGLSVLLLYHDDGDGGHGDDGGDGPFLGMSLCIDEKWWTELLREYNHKMIIFLL